MGRGQADGPQQFPTVPDGKPQVRNEHVAQSQGRRLKRLRGGRRRRHGMAHRRQIVGEALAGVRVALHDENPERPRLPMTSGDHARTAVNEMDDTKFRQTAHLGRDLPNSEYRSGSSPEDIRCSTNSFCRVRAGSSSWMSGRLRTCNNATSALSSPGVRPGAAVGRHAHPYY